jgi:hypothetical protein
MTRVRLFCAMTLAAVMSSSMPSVTEALQAVNLERALGHWHSTEQFEGEPRVQFAFRQRGNEIVGWVVMLGQQRKNNDRAVLALSFCDVRWDGDRVRFESILPDDEGTIGWEMRPGADGKGVLSAVTENGTPFPEPIVWDVQR